MRALLLALVIVATALPAAAQAAAAQDAALEGSALVLVVDPGHARVSPERLRRTIATTLGRELVRITDPEARDAGGTLTIAHDSHGRWLVRFDATGASASTHAVVARPGLYDVAIADAARRVVAEVEASRSAPAPAGSLRVAWADEILDPFANAPALPRRELAIVSEVIDPFAPVAARQRAFSEVLDPWGR